MAAEAASKADKSAALQRLLLAGPRSPVEYCDQVSRHASRFVEIDGLVSTVLIAQGAALLSGRAPMGDGARRLDKRKRGKRGSGKGGGDEDHK